MQVFWRTLPGTQVPSYATQPSPTVLLFLDCILSLSLYFVNYLEIFFHGFHWTILIASLPHCLICCTVSVCRLQGLQQGPDLHICQTCVCCICICICICICLTPAASRQVPRCQTYLLWFSRWPQSQTWCWSPLLILDYSVRTFITSTFAQRVWDLFKRAGRGLKDEFHSVLASIWTLIWSSLLTDWRFKKREQRNNVVDVAQPRCGCGRCLILFIATWRQTRIHNCPSNMLHGSHGDGGGSFS